LQKIRKEKLFPFLKKRRKKEERSEGKAQIAARIDSSIEQELLKRLKSGLYNDIYSFSSAQYEGEIIEQEQNQGKESHLQRGSALKQRKIKERREHIELEYE